jgi:GNAT superfamily N-acetyltransferase
MDGPRPPLDGEFAEVVRFLDRELRPGERWSIANEYPVAFDPGNAGNIRIITEGGEVLSHAVMRPLIVKSPAGLFKVGAIGSVVTREQRRSEGLSRQILESCLASARDHGCDFAILWTNLYDFYRKMGFELAGTEISATIEREIAAPVPPGWRVVEGARVAPEAIQRLFTQHTVGSLRSVDETRRYLQIPNSRVYTLWDDKGALKAYAIEGKGADLAGYAHEWGGGVSSLLPLLGHIRAKLGGPLTVIAPAHASNLVRRLREAGATVNQGYLGMIKILNPTHFFAKLKRHSRAAGIDDFVLEKQGDKFYFGSSASVFMTDSEADVTRLIFGPQKARDLHQFDAATLKTIETALPIPMWIWGWDSI